MSEWVYFKLRTSITDEEVLHRTTDGVKFYFKNACGWLNCEPYRDFAEVKAYYRNNVIPKQPKDYDQLETEARIKKLEWTIAEQQLEIERLRQNEFKTNEGKNNE